MCTDCKVGLESELSLIWYMEQRSSCLPTKKTTTAANVMLNPTLFSSSEMVILCIAEMT